MGKKVVVALNMMDLIRANGDKLDLELLSQELGCPVIPISARTGEGVNELVEKAVCLAQENHSTKDPNEFSKDIEELLGEIDECVELNGDFEKRWQLIIFLERDGKLLGRLQLN